MRTRISSKNILVVSRRRFIMITSDTWIRNALHVLSSEAREHEMRIVPGQCTCREAVIMIQVQQLHNMYTRVPEVDVKKDDGDAPPLSVAQVFTDIFYPSVYTLL